MVWRRCMMIAFAIILIISLAIVHTSAKVVQQERLLKETLNKVAEDISSLEEKSFLTLTTAGECSWFEGETETSVVVECPWGKEQTTSGVSLSLSTSNAQLRNSITKIEGSIFGVPCSLALIHDVVGFHAKCFLDNEQLASTERNDTSTVRFTIFSSSQLHNGWESSIGIMVQEVN
eukprot:m.23272 g.23272  ORF g.23272 m.23272 type:complete len:176 (-) comp5536_c0_seq2:1267-1794(-)